MLYIGVPLGRFAMNGGHFECWPLLCAFVGVEYVFLGWFGLVGGESNFIE